MWKQDDLGLRQCLYLNSRLYRSLEQLAQLVVSCGLFSARQIGAANSAPESSSDLPRNQSFTQSCGWLSGHAVRAVPAAGRAARCGTGVDAGPLPARGGPGAAFPLDPCRGFSIFISQFGLLFAFRKQKLTLCLQMQRWTGFRWPLGERRAARGAQKARCLSANLALPPARPKKCALAVPACRCYWLTDSDGGRKMSVLGKSILLRPCSPHFPVPSSFLSMTNYILFLWPVTNAVFISSFAQWFRCISFISVSFESEESIQGFLLA